MPTPPNKPAPAKRPIPKKTLAGVVGAVTAGLLLVNIPADESGRKVDVEISDTGEAKVRHVTGKQYLRAYLDIAGVATACDGITRGVRMGQTYTEEQCADLLEQELITHAEGVMRCTPSLGLNRPGMDYARFGAVSFAYNLGVGGWCGSTARKRLDAGARVGACDAMLSWSKARVGPWVIEKGRRVRALRRVDGLWKRRNRERQACLTGLPGYPPSTLHARMEKWR